MNNYLNTPITVNEQVAHQRGLPYIDTSVVDYYGTIDHDFVGGIMISLKSDNPMSNKPKVGDTIRMRVFYNEDISENAIISYYFTDYKELYELDKDYIPQAETWYCLEILPDNKLKIVDMEGYSNGAEYYNYYTVYNCIQAALKKAEKIIGKTLLHQHIILDNDDAEVRNLELLKLESEQIVSNVIVGDNTIELDIGFTKRNFPADLKQAIMNTAAFLYANCGDFIKANSSNYNSLSDDDISKSIYLKYRNWGI